MPTSLWLTPFKQRWTHRDGHLGHHLREPPVRGEGRDGVFHVALTSALSGTWAMGGRPSQ